MRLMVVWSGGCVVVGVVGVGLHFVAGTFLNPEKSEQKAEL